MQLPREWIGLVLVILGLVRAALLVAHDPVVGYANQYDMIRTSACLGLFPALPEPSRYEAHPDAPIPLYKTEAPRKDLCYQSTEVVIAATAKAAAGALGLAATGIKLQWIGYAKVALLALTVLIIAWAFHPHPSAALLHGLVVFALLCDPVVTLWFNSLYTEFAVFWAIYAVIASVTALAITERGAVPLGFILIIALPSLAFSREQFALLPTAMMLLAWPWVWQRSPHLTVVAFGVALVCSIVSFELMPRPPEVKLVNRADAYLGVVLPAASDPHDALTKLGLPERCDAMVGASWYRQRGEKLAEACPEVFKLSSLDFLKLASGEPQAIARAVARVLPATQELSPPQLGVLEGGKNVAMNELPWWLASPLHAIVWRLPVMVYELMVVVLAIATPLALLGAFGWARPSRTQHGAELLLAMLLGGVAVYTLATTVLGDGLSESARHFLPGALAMYAACIALVFAIVALALRWIAAPKQSAFEIVAAIIGIAAIVVGCRFAMNWAAAQPLAIGVIDEPQSRVLAPGAPLNVRGWAIDPHGVESVSLALGKLQLAATYGAESPTLKRFYPAYPDSDHAGYALDVSADDLAKAGAPDPLVLRVIAKSAAGPAFEIDRRRLEFRAP